MSTDTVEAIAPPRSAPPKPGVVHATRWRSAPLALLGLVVILGLGLRLWDIGERSFWLDELSAVGTSALELPALLQALTVEANMTLYYWALFVWLRVVGFGADEGTIRLLSALFGTAAIPFIYLLARRLHSPAAGLGAAALLAVNGFHILMSQEARAYALLSALTILSYLFLDRALQGGRRRDWLLHGVVTAAAFYSHFYTAFTMLAQGLLVLCRRSRAALLGLITSGIVMALLLVQLVPFFIRYSNGSKLSHLVRPDAGDFVNFFINFSGGSPALLAVYAVLVTLGLLAQGGRRSRAYRAWMVGTWFVVPVALSFGISLVRPIFNDRYLFAALPALPLLAGIGLTRLPRPLAVLAVALVAGLSINALAGDFQARRTEEWREAVAYTLRNAQPGDGWIFISKWGQNGFEYYAGWHWGRNPAAPYDDIFEPFDWRQAATVPKYRGVLDMGQLPDFAARHARIWLVLSHEFDAVVGGDTAEAVRNWLTRNGYAAKQRQYRSVRVILYQRQG